MEALTANTQTIRPAMKALVIFSGGQDSTTCLHWALKNFSSVEAIFFDYGQRHLSEKESAIAIAKKNRIHLHLHTIPFFAELHDNALTNLSIPIQAVEGSVPSTFVPGRNLIFLTLAAATAYTRNITDLVTGVCQTDYSGYPDCRQNTMDSLAQTLDFGMGKKFIIHTPLMYLSKAQTINLARDLGKDAWDDLALTHTCYEGTFPPCGKCPACLLRAKGFNEAKCTDPLLDRVKSHR